MFDSSMRKNGQSRYIACSNAMPSAGRLATQALTAVPKPYQAGSISRHCAQLNTHGIARKSSIRADDLRDDGRLPMLRLAISLITVDSRKNVSNPSVS